MASSNRIFVSALFVTAVATLGCQPPAGKKPTDPDLSVLVQLEKAGSDLSKPHNPEFFLYFSSKESAVEAAGRLEADGYSATVGPGAMDDGTWLCLATKSLVLTHEAIVSIGGSMDGLAAELGGEYDGWGSPVVE